MSYVGGSPPYVTWVGAKPKGARLPHDYFVTNADLQT